MASLPLDLSHLAATGLIGGCGTLSLGRAPRTRPCRPFVPPGHKSDPDLRENRVSDGMAAAAASGLTCRAWVLLTCGPPLAGGLVTGHGSSSDVADSRERAPQAPVAAARSDGAPGWRRSYHRRSSVE